MKKSSPEFRNAALKPQAEQLRAISRLLERNNLKAASDAIAKLRKQFPDYTPLYAMHVDVCLEMGDDMQAAIIAYDWTQRAPNSAKAWTYAAEIYLKAGLLMLYHEAALRLRALGVTDNRFAPFDEDILKSFQTDPFSHQELSTLVRFDLGRLFLGAGRLQQAIVTLDGIDCVPARNNQALAYFQSGQSDAAHALFLQAWEAEPRNLFALKWLVWIRLYQGDAAAARALAAPLRQGEAVRSEDLVAQLTGLLLLEEYASAWAVYQRQRDLLQKDSSPKDRAFLSHLAALAAVRLGQDEAARKLWKEALKLDPDLTVALDNLDDLGMAIHKRNGAYLQAWGHWFPQRFHDRLTPLINSTYSDPEKHRRIADAFEGHSYCLGAVYVQGDLLARSVALEILKIRMAQGEPAAFDALQGLLTHPAGSDQSRSEIAFYLQDSGKLPSDQTLDLFVNGACQHIRLQRSVVSTWARPSSLPESAQKQSEQAIYLMRSGKHAQAAEQLAHLLEQHPDDPLLINNLASAYQQLGKDTESMALLRRALAINPDYLFARCNLAKYLLGQQDTEAARLLLEGLWEKAADLHIAEARAVLSTTALLYAQEGHWEARDRVLGALEALQEEPEMA